MLWQEESRTFQILSLSYLFVILSFISEFGGGTGWTLYPPLSTSFMSLSPSTTAYLISGLLMSGISSCLTSINFFITILNLRSYYLELKTMPLFPWSLFITGGMLLLTLPILSGALLMVHFVWERGMATIRKQKKKSPQPMVTFTTIHGESRS